MVTHQGPGMGGRSGESRGGGLGKPGVGRGWAYGDKFEKSGTFGGDGRTLVCRPRESLEGTSISRTPWEASGYPLLFHSLPDSSYRKGSRAGGQLRTVLSAGPSCLAALSCPDVHAGLEVAASACSVHEFPPRSAPRQTWRQRPRPALGSGGQPRPSPGGAIVVEPRMPRAEAKCQLEPKTPTPVSGYPRPRVSYPRPGLFGPLPQMVSCSRRLGRRAVPTIHPLSLPRLPPCPGPGPTRAPPSGRGSPTWLALS